jgi:hypothetical protein
MNHSRRQWLRTAGGLLIAAPAIGQGIVRSGRTSAPYIPAVAGYDSDADAFFTAASITDSTQKSAVNQLVLDLKSASIWTPMLAIYPFVGGSADTHKYNLKSSSYTITWNGTVTHDSNGVTGNGTTGYGSTGLNLNTTTANSLAFGVYSRTDSQTDRVDISAFNITNGDGAYFHCRYNDGKMYSGNLLSGGWVSGDVAASLGLFVSSRTASNATACYRNGSSIATGTAAQGTLQDASFLVCAKSTEAGFSARNLSLAFISSGLTSTNVGNLATAVETFQDALSRGVM